jgi:predicted nucleic acid-binding protein
MIQRQSVIIDNDALVNLTKLMDLSIKDLSIFDLLRNLYSSILIPIEVKNEYEKQVGREPQRERILQQLRPNEGFFTLCTYYDTLSKTKLYSFSGIDAGEAEIVSQVQKTSVNRVISDDKRFKQQVAEYIPDVNIRFYNSLFVIACLDIHGYILPSSSLLFWQKLYHSPYHFSHEEFKEAYQAVQMEFGVKINPKKVSKNTYKAILNM